MTNGRIIPLLLLAAAPLAAQGTNAPLAAQNTGAPEWQEFSLGPAGKSGGRWAKDSIRGEGVPLKKVIARAYDLPEHRVVGPEWIGTQRYALTAVASKPEDLQPLLQRMLAERFQMEAHRETKEVPVYVLKALEGLQPNARPPVPVQADRREASALGLRLSHASMKDLADTLADMLLRPVFDETGIDGSFEISLNWKRGDAESLRKAVREQLGVNLIEERRAVELLLITRIERPQFTK
jgi:uncharacterized protein (TIGR03435 family)